MHALGGHAVRRCECVSADRREQIASQSAEQSA